MASMIERLMEQRRQAEAAAAGGILIPDVLSPPEMQFMASVWGQIRVAGSFGDINWSAHGYPAGPQISAASYAAITYVWPQIRVAANWNDINWSAHPIPEHVVAAALPVPEASADTPAPTVPASAVTSSPATTAPAPSASGGGYSYTPGSYVPDQYSDYPMDDPDSSAPKTTVQKAGLLSNLPFSLPVMLGLTALGFFLFGKPKLPGRAPRRRRRR